VTVDTPRWKKAYDNAEQQAAPAIQKFLSNPDVIEAITIGAAVQRRARDDTAKFIRRQLHAMNLPSGTDVRSVSNQIAGLERQIRLLAKQVDDLQTKNAVLEANLADRDELDSEDETTDGDDDE